MTSTPLRSRSIAKLCGLVLAVTWVLSGCASGSSPADSAAGAAATGTVTAEDRAAVRKIRAMVHAKNDIFEARRRLVVRCMSERGYSVLPPEWGSSARGELVNKYEEFGVYALGKTFPNATAASPSIGFAKKFGYGFAVQAATKPETSTSAAGGKVTNAPFYNLPQSKQSEIMLALTGTGYAPEGSEPKSTPFNESCIGQVESQLYGDDFNKAAVESVPHSVLGGPSWGSGYKIFAGNKKWEQARESWISCMADKGYAGLTEINAIAVVAKMYGIGAGAPGSPNASSIPPQSWAPKRLSFTNKQRARDIEYAVALADAQCAKRHDVNDIYRKLLTEYQAHYVANNRTQINTYVTEMKKVVKRARKALERG